MTSLKQIAGSMIVTGIVLAIIGFASGGKWSITLDRTGFQVPDEGTLETKSYELDAFTSINIVNDYGDIEILQSDSYALEIKSIATTDITYEVKDGTLTVKAKKLREKPLTIGVWQSEFPSIKVYIPKDAKLANIVLETSFGDVKMQQLNYEQLNLFADYGDIAFKNITAGQTEITQDFGDMALQQFSSDSLVAKSEYGDIAIDGTLNGKTTITSNLGDVDLQLLNKYSDLGFELNTDLGDITLNGKDFGSKHSQVHKGDNQLDVSLSLGELDLSLQ
ncbi:MAG: DUF4097 family beta strand repeat-containing protein [Lysinibacillus sp.]